MKNGAKISREILKLSAGVKIYMILSQTTKFRNFNVKPDQGKPSFFFG